MTILTKFTLWLILSLLLALPSHAKQSNKWILIDKSERVLVLMQGNDVVRRYDGIALGFTPTGAKRFQGDGRTPEGRYHINNRNPASSYHLSLQISYPNAQDRAYARSMGRDAGGLIMIHGQPNQYKLNERQKILGDWTAGCIALTNSEMSELWSNVEIGMPVIIRE